jgi:hypothetical protein
VLFKKNSILDIGTRIVNETCGEVQGSGIRRIWSELVHQFLELCHIVSNGRRLLDMDTSFVSLDGATLIVASLA